MTTAKRRVVQSDLVEIKWPMEPAFSRDGQKIAYVVSGPDGGIDRVAYRLAVLDRATGTSTQVEGIDDIRSPAWSPDGESLACIAGGVVAVVDDAGHAARAAASPRGVRSFAWSPGGKDIVAVNAGWPQSAGMGLIEVTSIDDLRKVAPDEVSIFPIDGADPRRLPVDGLTDIQHLAIAPDGVSLAFAGRRPGGVTPAAALSLFVFELSSGVMTELIPPDGLIKAVAWSPDGESLAYIGHQAGGSHIANLELRVVAANGGGLSTQIGSSLDRSIGQVVRGDDERGTGPADLEWTADGIFTACAFGGSSTILRFDVTGDHDLAVGGDRAILGFTMAPPTDEIAFVWSDSSNPGEMSVCGLDGSDEKQLTHVNGAWATAIELADTEKVEVVASDGVVVDGWLTVPATAPHPHPVVLQVHGGPHYPVGNRFSFDAQRLAALGIAMVRANPRGSQGYGMDFAAGIRGDWGGRDFADLREILDVVTARPDIDSSRVAIVGESYGGFMVNWALGQDDRFVAGIAENAIAFLGGVATGVAGVDFWHDELGQPAWQAGDLINAASPLFNAASITAPLLLIHADDDRTVPISQSEAMYVALRSLGHDVRFYRIPGESHWVNVLGAPSRRLERLEVFDRFLVEHLGGASPSPTDGGVA